MTHCTFFVLSAAEQFADFLGEKSFNSFAEARTFLAVVRDTNLDALEQLNGYVAMLCQIYN